MVLAPNETTAAQLLGLMLSDCNRRGGRNIVGAEEQEF